MKKLIEFIKKIFNRRSLVLNEGKVEAEEICSKQKEIFLNNIVVEDNSDSISVLQIRLEEGLIKEEELSNEQINRVRGLYCDQVADLVNSIKSYKLKLNEDVQ